VKILPLLLIPPIPTMLSTVGSTLAIGSSPTDTVGRYFHGTCLVLLKEKGA
ncbi:hypothetical protein A2U01_0084008, partial [Trifolium medium]|nr:hypothetical protein [Trifolium medium]